MVDSVVKKESHPVSLWMLSFVYMGFTVSFGTFLSVLLIFLNKNIGMGENDAFQLFSSVMSLAFVMPLIGGYLCDKFGFRNITVVGLIFTFLGFMLISVPGKSYLYLGLAVFLSGNALCTPAIWSQVGLIYKKNSFLRESGSTIFYMLLNFGFLFSTLSAPFMVRVIGYHWVFFMYGLTPLLSLAIYLFYSRKLDLVGLSSNVKEVTLKRMIFSLISAALLVVPVFFLLSNIFINNVLLIVCVIVAFSYVVVLMKRQEKVAVNKMVAFMALCLLGLSYLVIYNTEFSILPEYALHALDRVVLGVNFPASVVPSFDSIFCIIFGVGLIRLWAFLGARGKSPKLSTKFAIGLLFSALGYLLLALILFFYKSEAMSLLWLIPPFALFVMGELLVLPTGIAMAGKLAPAGYEGFFMGIWNMMTGFSALLTGYIAYFTVVKPGASILETNTSYLQVFLSIGVVVFFVALIAFALNGRIKKLLV